MNCIDQDRYEAVILRCAQNLRVPVRFFAEFTLSEANVLRMTFADCD